jgi:hypothetical protein
LNHGDNGFPDVVDVFLAISFVVSGRVHKLGVKLSFVLPPHYCVSEICQVQSRAKVVQVADDVLEALILLFVQFLEESTSGYLDEAPVGHGCILVDIGQNVVLQQLAVDVRAVVPRVLLATIHRDDAGLPKELPAEEQGGYL